MQYLYDPNFQFLDTGGSPLVGGHLEVYIAFTDDAAATYTSLEAVTLNPQKITLDSNGRAVVVVDEAACYRLEVYDAEGLLLWTVQPYNASGTLVYTPVEVTGTDGEIDVASESSSGKKIFTVSLSDAVKTELSDLDDAISSEANERETADNELQAKINAEAADRTAADEDLIERVSAESTARAEKDSELETAVAGKQDRLTAGDNIAISTTSVISVTGRKRLKVQSPVTATADDESLTIGLASGVYATADALAEEASAREAADETLQANIDSESAERQTEDTSLQAQISVEAANRETADNGLQTAIDSEASARETADSALQTAVDNEATAREEADTALQTAVDGKQDTLTFDSEPTSGSSNPVTSDGIYQAIQAEALVRVTQTTTNSKNLSTEISERQSADKALQAQIDAFSADLGDYTTYDFPTASSYTDATEILSLGNVSLCGYTDSSAALRLLLKSTDGNNHSCWTNGGGYNVTETGSASIISTDFRNANPYLRFYCYDATDGKFWEYDIYSFSSSLPIFARKITEQTIGG